MLHSVAAECSTKAFYSSGHNLESSDHGRLGAQLEHIRKNCWIYAGCIKFVLISSLEHFLTTSDTMFGTTNLTIRTIDATGEMDQEHRDVNKKGLGNSSLLNL